MEIGRHPLPVLTSSFPGRRSQCQEQYELGHEAGHWSQWLFFLCTHPRQASHNYLRRASPAHRLFAQPLRDLLSWLASFTVSVHTAVPERYPFSNRTSPRETNICSSMDAQTLGCTYLLGLGTLLWTGSLHVHRVPCRQPAWMAHSATLHSPQGSICEVWTLELPSKVLVMFLSELCPTLQWGGEGGRVDIQDSEHGRIMGRGLECLNLCSGRKGTSLSTEVMVQGIQPTAEAVSVTPWKFLGMAPVHDSCELAHELKPQVLREDTCPQSIWTITAKHMAFPSGPGAKMPHSQGRGPKFDPWSGD